MKKQILFIALSMILFGCSSKPIEKSAEGEHTNDKGDKSTASIDLEDDKIVKVSIDEIAAGEAKSKKELGDSYNMKEASSIKKEWYQQVEFLEEYIAKNGVDDIALDSNGKAENNDVKSGCTISIKNLLEAVEDAEENGEKEVK